MPLTTTATWPDLVSGKKAKASEVEAKFDWIEGTLYSHNAGNQTDNVYDIGTSTNRFRSGYFGTAVYINGQQIAESGFVKGWGSFNTAGGTITTNDSFNISSITYSPTGNYVITWTIPFENSNSSAVVTCRSLATAGIVPTVYVSNTATTQILTYNTSATAETNPSSGFNIITTGNQ